MPDPTQQSATPQIDPASGMPSGASQEPEAPQTPAPTPAPGGVTWDPTPDTTDLMATATKLGGPLGGLAIGAMQGAHAHENQDATGGGVKWDDKPDLEGLSAPVKVRYALPGKGIFDFTRGTPEEKEFLTEHPQAAPRPYPTGEAYMAEQNALAEKGYGHSQEGFGRWRRSTCHSPYWWGCCSSA